MSRILITGGSGFLGSHLIRALEDHDVRAPSMDVMDLRDGRSVQTFVECFKPEVVIHLAAKTEVALSFDDFEDFTRTNYLGTVLLAEMNRLHNPSMRQFIFASTMETYGHHDPQRGAFTEYTPQRPCAPYAVAKLASEKYLEYMDYAYDFPSTILRQTNTYGRVNTTFFVMERIISQMLTGNVVNLGAADPMRNFLFIDDLVQLYLTILDRKAAIGETFVTGPDNALSIKNLAALCAKVLKWKGTINWDTIPERPGEIMYLNSHPGRAEMKLGWRPKIDLDTGIKLTADRMLATPGLLKAA